MPRPVEALPWGSRSMISTSSPMAARAVPRLMAVVVLPTPPFWLARAMTRGDFGRLMRVRPSVFLLCLETRDVENHRVILNLALVFYQIEVPRFSGLVDFPLIIAALWENGSAPER